MGRRSESPQPRRRGSRSASMSRSHSRSPSRSPKAKAGNKRASSRSRSPSHSRSKSRSPSRGRKNDGGRRRSRSRERNDRHRDDRRGGGRDRGGDRRRSRSRSGSRGRRDGGGHMNRGRPEPQSLLVRNLDPSTTEADLRHAFTRNEGDIRDVYIPKEFGGSQPRGFAFIEFNDRNVARERKYEMDRTELQGREIAVLFAQQRRKTPDQMREIMPMGGNSYRGRSDHREDRGGRDHENRRSPIRD